jgi:hypothetical protein
MKITKQQELNYIVSITAGLLASGHFTYVRQDSKGPEVRGELLETTDRLWDDIKTFKHVEIVDAPHDGASLASQPGGTLKQETRKGK